VALVVSFRLFFEAPVMQEKFPITLPVDGVGIDHFSMSIAGFDNPMIALLMYVFRCFGNAFSMMVRFSVVTEFGEGALLGDRATMINSQNDRVFMRSMATRGQGGGLSPATHECLALLARSDFDYVIIETVGTGQEAMPFQKHGVVDQTVLVMNPDYGSRLQLQKIVMLDLADIVVVNKSDLQRARTAHTEIEQRLEQNRRNQHLIDTVAKRHRDPGVDQLFELISNR